MVDLNNNSKWENDVYIKQSGDAVKKTHEALANRTEYLKENLEALTEEVKNSVSANALQENLINTSDDKLGDAMIGVKQPFAGAVARTQHDKNTEQLSSADFGALGDGTSNETEIFLLIDSVAANRTIDLLGKTYLVNKMPTKAHYFNGYFLINGTLKKATYKTLIKAWDHEAKISGPGNGLIAIGTNTAKNLPSDQIGHIADNIAMGRDALGAATQSNMNIAIGAQTMSKNTPGAANIAIGSWALTNITGDPSKVSNTTGSRNIAIGALSLHFLEKGYRNVCIGRDAGHSLVDQHDNTSVGYGSLSHGHCTMFVDGKITNQQIPVGGNGNSALGSQAGAYNAENYNVFVGHQAAKYSKNLYASVFVGAGAAGTVQKNTSINGRIISQVESIGTYIQIDTDIIITMPSHNVIVGNYVTLRFTSGEIYNNTNENVCMKVSSIDGNSFTVVSPVKLSTRGEVILVNYETDVIDDAANSKFITVVGRGAALSAQQIYNNNTIIGGYSTYSAIAIKEGNTVIGSQGARNAIEIGAHNVILGTNAGAKSTSIGTQNTVVGGYAGEKMVGNGNALFGYSSGGALTTGDSNTLIGRDAGYRMVTGETMKTANNVTCIGAYSCVSGSNQIQLGNSETTPYAYQPLQLRSDIRDTTDIRDSDLGIDFILGLRPVRGKWNIREDYLEKNEVQVGISKNGQPIYETRIKFNKTDYLAKTKKRTRDHEWFIAQEVETLCKKMGVDFSGLHHSSVNGGSDVYSLGYDSFIPPIVKAIQDCWNKITILENRIEKLESK